MILFLFMRNLKRIQNQLYLKNSLIQFNSLIKSGTKDNIYTNVKTNSNDYNNNDNQIITSNGGNEVEINDLNNGGAKTHSSKDLYCFNSDNKNNNYLSDKNNNKKNQLIGSFLFKDFEIKDDEYEIIKPKKCLSSTSLNEIKNNGSDKNIINKKKKLKDIIININNKKYKKYFTLWKKILKNDINSNENRNIDNGMNISEINNARNYLTDRIIEVNTDDFNSTNEVKFLDNGIDIEYDDIEIKNTEINNEIMLNTKRDDMERKINKLRYTLIKFVVK